MSQDLFQEIWRIEKDELATAFATMRLVSWIYTFICVQELVNNVYFS